MIFCLTSVLLWSLKYVSKSRLALNQSGRFFAPNLGRSEEVLETIITSIEEIGLVYLDDISIALDCAAAEFYEDGKYNYKKFEEMCCVQLNSQ